MKKIAVMIWRIFEKVIEYIFFIFPVAPKKIIFNNFNGSGFGCNPKYIAQELHEQCPEWDMVWIIKNKKQYIPNYMRGVKENSLKLLYELATSHIIVTNVKCDIKIVKKKNQYVIQTWHASFSPKYMEQDACDKLGKRYLKESKLNSEQTDLFLSNSSEQSKEYRKAFWCECEIMECGYPRNDILFSCSNELKIDIKRRLKIHKLTKIVLYTPTFREDDSIDAYQLDCEKVIDCLERQGDMWKLLIRMHPNVRRYKNIFQFGEKIIDVTDYPDIQELLVAADMLITDFSTTMVDFSIMKKPVFLFAIDIEQYIKQRGLKPVFFDFPFSLSRSNEELIENIEKFNNIEYLAKIEKFVHTYASGDKGIAAKSVVERIMSL